MPVVFQAVLTRPEGHHGFRPAGAGAIIDACWRLTRTVFDRNFLLGYSCVGVSMFG